MVEVNSHWYGSEVHIRQYIVFNIEFLSRRSRASDLIQDIYHLHTLLVILYRNTNFFLPSKNFKYQSIIQIPMYKDSTGTPPIFNLRLNQMLDGGFQILKYELVLNTAKVIARAFCRWDELGLHCSWEGYMKSCLTERKRKYLTVLSQRTFLSQHSPVFLMSNIKCRVIEQRSYCLTMGWVSPAAFFLFHSRLVKYFMYFHAYHEINFEGQKTLSHHQQSRFAFLYNQYDW